MSNSIQAKNIIKNIKLLERSLEPKFSLNQIRVIIALERLVARFEANPVLAKHLVFKGGFALLKHINSARFTHDLDASYFLFSLEKLIPIITSSIDTDLRDGMWYGDIRHEKILLEKDYDGVRFNCAFQIGDPPDESKINKLSRVHFDIGLSDEKFPQHHKTEMPSMLDNFHPISWYVYPLEQIFAEKLETFVKRGAKNSRAKDLYDMVNIYPNCQNKNDLNQTIQRVFRDRDTDLPISLRDFAQNLDQTILRAGWASIIASEPRPAFDENWIKLLGILADLKR